MKPLIRKSTAFSLLPLYFSRFILTTIPAQLLLILLFLRRPALPPKIYIYLLMVIIYWVTVLLTGYSNIRLQHLLFYFSFIPPLLFMLAMKPNANIQLFITDKFIVVICILTITEAFLVNSPLIDYLYFFPQEGSSERTNFMGFYQRPLGISGNASMTSAILIFSIVLADAKNKIFSSAISGRGIQGKKKIKKTFDRRMILITICILTLASSTGFILLLLYFLIKYRKYFILISALIALLFLGAPPPTEDDLVFQKISITYVKYIYNHKVNSLIQVFKFENKTITSVLFGEQANTSMLHAATSSDFGFLVMYYAIGVLGSVLVLSTPLLFMSSLRAFFIPTIFFYFSFIHYPALLSPPGAVLFSLYIYLMACHSRLRS